VTNKSSMAHAMTYTTDMLDCLTLIHQGKVMPGSFLPRSMLMGGDVPALTLGENHQIFNLRSSLFQYLFTYSGLLSGLRSLSSPVT